MKYINTQQAAKLWGISDRRVRVLCSEGKITGTVKDGKSYNIPADAQKPTDGRLRISNAETAKYLKWDNDIIGKIDYTNSVYFIAPNYNEVISIYTNGQVAWTPEQFTEFLSERVVSRDRRDIEKILFRCGLSHYDVLRIAEITRGIHPKDLLWIAHNENEKLENVMTDVFQSVFRQRIDLVGDSINTPEGYNIKRYGVYDGQYGIYKQRINPLVTDVESEIAVYLLAQRMGIRCCPAYLTDKDTVFSAFLFDFSKEYIVHFRRLFDGPRTENEYQNLIHVRPEYKKDIARMVLLDFITRQDDRHLSNIAIKISGKKETFYPLYDNGRSLFYEDTEETVAQAIENPIQYATSFGYSGTYWDYVQEVAKEHDIKSLINLDIFEDEVSSILHEAGFQRYRLDGALKWVMKTIQMIKEI
jgi:tRNA(Ile)-lysidine synthase TilS/MesJ